MSNRTHPSNKRPASGIETTRTRALLQIWLSPSFPVGGFAYSHGLEKAAENGWIVGRADLETWLSDLIAHGSLRNDLTLLAAAWRAVRGLAGPTLRDVAELALGLQPSIERHLEATQQGHSFLLAIEAAWPPDATRWSALAGEVPPTYPVAVALAAAAHGVPLAETLEAFAVAFAGNLTAAAIRLSLIGQTDAQLILAALLDSLLVAAHSAEASTLEDIGSTTWRSDIASMQHETQHSRLFRS